MKLFFLLSGAFFSIQGMAQSRSEMIQRNIENLPKTKIIENCPDFSGEWKGTCFQNSFPQITERVLSIYQTKCSAVSVRELEQTEHFIIENGNQHSRGSSTRNYAMWKKGGKLTLLWESLTTGSFGAVRTTFDEILFLDDQGKLNTEGVFSFRSFNHDFDSYTNSTHNCTLAKLEPLSE